MTSINIHKTTFLKTIITLIVCAFIVTTIILQQIYHQKKVSKQPDGYKVTQYSDSTGNQASFYTIETPNNELIIIDGGWAANESQVREVIAAHKNTVDAWIVSHPHQDHAGAFNQIYANPQGITIKTIYDSPIDYEAVKKSGEKWDDLNIFETYRTLTKDATNITSLHRGDTFDLFGLNVLVLNAYDEKVPANSMDYTNDGSLMFKVSSENKSMIFCSDVKWMDEVISNQFEKELACTYIQVAHHGNWAFPNEFYDLTHTKVAFFDSPAWIMTDSNYPAFDLSKYLSDKGIEIYDLTTAPNIVYLD